MSVSPPKPSARSAPTPPQGLRLRQPDGAEPKIAHLSRAGGSSRRSRLLCCGMWVCGSGSGGRGEGDGEPEGFQLADVVAGLLGFVDAAGVVAGAKVVVAGGGVGEQVPDDDQDGAGDGD